MIHVFYGLTAMHKSSASKRAAFSLDKRCEDADAVPGFSRRPTNGDGSENGPEEAEAADE